MEKQNFQKNLGKTIWNSYCLLRVGKRHPGGAVVRELCQGLIPAWDRSADMPKAAQPVLWSLGARRHESMRCSCPASGPGACAPQRSHCEERLEAPQPDSSPAHGSKRRGRAATKTQLQATRAPLPKAAQASASRRIQEAVYMFLILKSLTPSVD